MHRLLGDHSEPDCLSFDCYRFAPADSVLGVPEGRYEDVGFKRDVTATDELAAATRREIARDFFTFRQRFPLGVMTMVLASRAAIERLPNGLFRAPFPDFYAVGALMLTAKRWIHVAEPMLVVGISPNSVAGRFHRGERNEAFAHLGELDTFPGALPGNPFVNATCRWLTELKGDFPDELAGVEIDRSQYLVRTAWAWYREYSSGGIDRRELLSRFRLLSGADRARLVRGGLRIRNLSYAASAFRKRRDLEREMLLSSTRPTDARTLEEFVAGLRPR
jgi:hypothetical protein